MLLWLDAAGVLGLDRHRNRQAPRAVSQRAGSRARHHHDRRAAGPRSRAPPTPANGVAKASSIYVSRSGTTGGRRLGRRGGPVSHHLSPLAAGVGLERLREGVQGAATGLRPRARSQGGGGRGPTDQGSWQSPLLRYAGLGHPPLWPPRSPNGQPVRTEKFRDARQKGEHGRIDAGTWPNGHRQASSLPERRAGEKSMIRAIGR